MAVYGPTTTGQLIEGKHMKRSLTAHATTLQAMHDLYLEAFFEENPNLQTDGIYETS